MSELKIRRRSRFTARATREGFIGVYDEWQVVQGRKVLARCELKQQAERELERIKREREP